MASGYTVNFGDFDEINETDTEADVLIEVEPYGNFVGLKLERQSGQVNAADAATAAIRLRIYSNENQDEDYLVFDAEFDGADLTEDNPLWYDKTTLNVRYDTENVRGGGSTNTPYFWCHITTTGIANPVVADFVFRLRLETERSEGGN